MRPDATRTGIASFVVFILVITFSFPPVTQSKVNNLNEVPVIKLTSIHGYSAEVSDYHFDSQQNFCFTLTNTSSLPINGIGADLGAEAFVSITSQTDLPGPGFLVESFLVDHTLNGVPMSFVLVMATVPPGASTTICLAGLAAESADDIAHNLFVTFSPNVSLRCVDRNNETEDVLVAFTRSTDTEQCLIIINISTEIVTGLGLDLTGFTNSFELMFVNPSPQPFKQHLRLAKNPGSIDDFDNIPLSFGLLSGGQFSHGNSRNGVGPGEVSAEFCIAGNFQGLTLEELERRTYMRTDDSTRTCFLGSDPIGKGQTGVLAGEPR